MMKDNIGLRIKLARVALRWTQQDLAEKVNKTRPLITRIEQTGQGNYHTLREICKVLSIDMDVPDGVSDRTIREEDYVQRTELLENISMLNTMLRTQQETIRALKKEKEELLKKVKQLERKIHRK